MMDVTILLYMYTILYGNMMPLVVGIQSSARRGIATIYKTTPVQSLGGELVYDFVRIQCNPLVFLLHTPCLSLPGNIHMHKNVLKCLNYALFIADMYV